MALPFLQRQLYGITATLSDEHGETKLRLFNEVDVFGIALAWMLFESGLRTQTIRSVLNKLASTKSANAKKAAQVLLRSQVEFIVVVREARKPKSKDQGLQVFALAETEVSDIVANNPTANILTVPIGAKFADIEKRIAVLYGE
jgi:predicted Fe-Mo cluster-binding NifX family protein